MRSGDCWQQDKRMRSDNAELHLELDELWTQLNYQLIHLLDFLPVTHSDEAIHSGLFPIFIGTHAVLTRAG